MLRALVVGCDWCQISWMGTLTWFGLAALTTPQPATSHSWVHWSVQVSYLIPGFTCTSVQCLVFVFVDMHHKCNTVLRHRSGVPEEWQFVLKSLVASTSGRHKWQAQVLGMNVCTEMYAASTASCRFTRPPCQLCPCRVWCSATNLSPIKMHLLPFTTWTCHTGKWRPNWVGAKSQWCGRAPCVF
jgi:hypothetical protein